MQLLAHAHSKLPEEDSSNFYHLVMDIAWFGMALPATVRFLSVYAIRLGANPSELSWIVSLPALVLLFSAGLGNRWITRYADPIRAIFWPSLGFRFIFLLPVLTPFLPREWQPLWLILSVTIPALPQGISSVVFLVMMRQAVHHEHLTSLLSRRSLALNVTVAISGLAFGFWLEQAPFPVNYQAMFLLAFALALVSQLHLTRIHIQPVTVIPPEAQVKSQPWRSPQFRYVALIAAITHLAFFAIFPLIPLHLVKNLGASEGFMALFALAELAAGALISTFAPRVVQRLGNRRMVAVSMVGTGLAALIVASAPDLSFTLIAGAISGASWTLVGMGIFGCFTESTPAEEMGPYTVSYHQVIFAMMFVGPLVGSLLVITGVQLPLVLLIGAAARFAAGVASDYRTLERVEKLSHHALSWVGK
jgi:MFS family permease